MGKYTEEEDRELNKTLRKWQNRAKRLILHDYYDCIAEIMSELDHSILQQVTNAETHYDVNYALWNSGVIERVLDKIARKIKEARRKQNECRKRDL